MPLHSKIQPCSPLNSKYITKCAPHHRQNRSNLSHAIKFNTNNTTHHNKHKIKHIETKIP
ncbi:hypothetical protein Fmac_010505 [Flemingia macrophylla]|uniref:Uncharacterized protein n=1 Tax=Flemingia macrophylla TaxID=520843 RepID=A0ABD1MJS9_9FABA